MGSVLAQVGMNEKRVGKENSKVLEAIVIFVLGVGWAVYLSGQGE